MTNPRKMMMAAAGLSTSEGTNYLFAWGSGGSGRLGVGNTTSYSSPIQVDDGNLWSEVAAQGNGAMALKNDGTMWGWGAATHGKLGLGNTTTYSSPVQVGSLEDWAGLSVESENHCHAVKTDGTLWAWGKNNHGMLGDGSTTVRSSPVQIGSLTNWTKKISSVYHNTHAVKSDGTLWGWGYNQYHSGIGDGTLTSRSSPVQIGSATDWANVYSHRNGGHAVTTAGRLWGWGQNASGEIGDGSSTRRAAPVQIGSLTTWVKCVPCSQFARCALKTDGTLWSWGGSNNEYRPLGTTTNYSSPVQVGSLTNWADIFGCGGDGKGGGAVKTDGTLWAWGANSAGQLGDGSTTKRTSPVQIGSLTTWGGDTSINFGGQFRTAIFINEE
jgi:alpha-tubulin suppressor-like RCC1 family protein